jgi:hypothetical protein
VGGEAEVVLEIGADILQGGSRLDAG